MSVTLEELVREVQELRTQVARIDDIEAVKRTKYKYWRSFDTADLQGMSEVLHPDVVLSVVAGIYSMRLEGRDAYVEMVKQGAHADMISHHNGHHGEIDIVGRTRRSALGISMMTCSNIAAASGSMAPPSIATAMSGWTASG